MTKREKIILIIIIIFGVLLFKATRPSGIVEGVIPDPYQKKYITTKLLSIETEKGTYAGEILADYKIEGVVKGKRKYTTDVPSAVSPYDLAMAWGELNKDEIDQHITYSQGSRWYYYRYNREVPVSGSYIAKHSANVHIIPANKQILNQIKSIKEGEHIILEGYLVEVGLNGSDWTSSLSRNDTGNGACEIMYVTKLIKK